MSSTNDVTLVTGAGRGLGHDYIESLIARGQPTVAIVRDNSSLVWSSKVTGMNSPSVLELNLNSPTLYQELESFLTTRHLNVVRILHAAGGGLGLKDPLISRDALNQLLVANLYGALEINRLLIPKMIAHEGGAIVHVGSTAATHALGSVGYNTAKSALHAYVRSAGREFIGQKVLIAGINPGAFEATDNAMSRLRIRNPVAYKAFVEKQLPRKRMGRSDEFFPAIDLLLFGASDIFAGSMIAMDAGESLAYD